MEKPLISYYLRFRRATYINNLSRLYNNSSFEDFCPHRSRVSCLSKTFPDISFPDNNSAQVIPQSYFAGTNNDLNPAINRVHITVETELHYKPMYVSTAHIFLYTDVLYATNDYLSSHIASLVTILGTADKFYILDNQYNKSRRFLRSIMAGEVCGFMGGLYFRCTIVGDL